MKDVIFISHATPVDNNFAVWLATKLELFGYKVWVDVNDLNPSVDFWNTIESAMFVLHDLYLEYEGLTAQIDFLVVTRRRNFVLECKNLYGNITVNNSGDFVRQFGNKKEGIYSPITQGRRHLELIKQIRNAEQKNIINRALFEKYFYDNYRSVVVLANPKTIINAKFATKEVKQQIIRADQLSEYIRKVNATSEGELKESDMEKLANFFLSIHRPCPIDYLEKYRKQIQENKEESEEKKAVEIKQSAENADAPICPKCGVIMVKRIAKKGANVGKGFWGCPNFPKCREILNG